MIFSGLSNNGAANAVNLNYISLYVATVVCSFDGDWRGYWH
jgi:hypothetical protein